VRLPLFAYDSSAANNGYTLELAPKTLASNEADLIAFGSMYLANPDLAERFKKGAPLSQPDQSTFYGGEAKGYTDYPTLSPTLERTPG
jgi:N-ethylmaleimide reductase